MQQNSMAPQLELLKEFLTILGSQLVGALLAQHISAFDLIRQGSYLMLVVLQFFQKRKIRNKLLDFFVHQ